METVEHGLVFKQVLVFIYKKNPKLPISNMGYEIKLQEFSENPRGRSIAHHLSSGYFIVVMQSSMQGDQEIELLGTCLKDNNAAICKVDANSMHQWITKGAAISKSVSPIIRNVVGLPFRYKAKSPKSEVEVLNTEIIRHKEPNPVVIRSLNKEKLYTENLYPKLIKRLKEGNSNIIEGRIKNFERIKKLFEEQNEQFVHIKTPLKRKEIRVKKDPKQIKYTDKYNHDTKTPFKVLTDLDELDESLNEMKYNEFNELEFNVYVRDPLKRTGSIEQMMYFVSSQDDYDVDGKIGGLLKFEFEKATVNLSLKPLFKGKSSLLVEIINDFRPVTKYRLNFEIV